MATENKKILLLCASGMSTSLLMNKMKACALENKVPVDIEAMSELKIAEILNSEKIDAILLGPQIRFKEPELRAVANEHKVPLGVIDSVDYGQMAAKRILAQAIKLIKEAQSNA
jgi:PTS system cellobiose-specific IIB component